MKKGRITLITVFILCFILVGCSSEQKAQDAKENLSEQSQEEDSNEMDQKLLSGKHNIEIMIKDYGTIAVELDADAAPITVTNMINLINDGFYDGLTFHRIISGFMIQGGDPNRDGTGGAETTIKGEFSDNGVENPLKHTRGAISMARSIENNSASSQFFIVHEDSPHLNSSYAAFGYVTEGMEIVDRICDETPVKEGQNGLVDRENQPVIEKITVITVID